MVADVMSWHTILLLWFSIIFFTSYIDMVRTDIKIGGYSALHRARFLTSGTEGEIGGNELDAGTSDNSWGPADNNTVTNVTVQLGVTAYLHCRTHAVGDNAGHVSWIRRRDWHILSSGMFTYTNDERFQIMHSEGSEDWVLKIRYVQKRDNGTYECQVSTGTGLISHFVNLQIVVPEAFIQGTAERHVDVGSIISLVCIIQKSPTPPQYVFWYHNDRMINYDTSRNGISVETLPGAQTQSRLTIRDTNDSDTGNYTCSASNTEPASIYVFVEEGDKMASLRKKSSGAGNMYLKSCQMFSIFMSSLLVSIYF